MVNRHTKWIALLANGHAIDGDVTRFFDVPREQVAAFCIVTDGEVVFVMEGQMPLVYRRRSQASDSYVVEVMHFLGMEDRIVGVAPGGQWRALPTFDCSDWWSQPIEPMNEFEREWMRRIQEPRVIVA